jgi:hypothetical protein
MPMSLLEIVYTWAMRLHKKLVTTLLTVFAATVLIAGCGGSSPSKTTKTSTNGNGRLIAGKPVAATQSQLLYYQNSVKHPVYWIGPFTGFSYELTETSNGDSYIRYLPAGVAVGGGEGDYTIIGTYPAANAYPALLKNIKTGNWTSHAVTYKGVAAWTSTHPHSVYLAYPKLSYLIEIYDPSPVNARKIALSGELEPIRSNEVAVTLNTSSPTKAAKKSKKH